MESNDKLSLDFVTQYLPFILMTGAIVGYYEFCEYCGKETKILEAILAPTISAVGFAFLAYLIALIFGIANKVLNTETKKYISTAIVIIIAIIACVTKVI